jgi:hypothetical protein
MTTTASQSNEQGDAVKILLLLVLQSALSGKRLDSTDLLGGLLGGNVGGIQTVEQNKNDTDAASRADPIALLLPLLVERLLGPTNVSDRAPTKVDSPQSPTQPAMTRPSVQLSVAGLAGTSILQALGILGTPFGLGALPTAAGTLATLIPVLTGVFGATNGFSSLLGGVQSLFKGFAKPA